MKNFGKVKKGVFRLYVSEEDAWPSLTTCCKFLSGDEDTGYHCPPWLSVLKDVYDMTDGNVLSAIKYIELIWTGDKIRFSEKYRDVRVEYVKCCDAKSYTNIVRIVKEGNSGETDDLVVPGCVKTGSTTIDFINKFLKTVTF